VAERLYRDDPNWVPPLRSDLAKVFSDENPFFRHAEIQLFVARRAKRDVGRIAAILDRGHNAFHGEQTSFFGFFECENDPEVARLLFDAAALWGRERKMSVLRGPVNPSLNDEAGLLVDGFGSPPIFMMTYNPAYYPALLEGAGFRKARISSRTFSRSRRLPRDGLSGWPSGCAGESRTSSSGRSARRRSRRTCRRSGRSTTRRGKRTGVSCR
jgi:hypothetical protein